MGESNDTIGFGQGHRDFEALCLVIRAWLGPTLVLNINRKPYKGSPMALSNLTLRDIKRSKVKVTDSQALYLVKEFS